MTAASPGNAPDGKARENLFSRVQIWFLSIVVLLLALCIGFAWMNRGVMKNRLTLAGGAQGRAAARTIVDLSPWQSAAALTQMAVTAEEKAYAQQAERLADHSVDQAFAAALREATLNAQKRKLTGEAQAISQRIQELQQTVAQDQAAVKQLTGGKPEAKTQTKEAAKAPQESDNSDDTDVEIAKAQLQLDSDQLDDAQEDLDRATGDERPQIRSELSAREAAMKSYDSGAQQQAQYAAQSVGQYQTLYRRLGAWNRQRTRMQMLGDAQRDAEAQVANLTAKHDALEAKLKGTAASTADGGQERGTRLAQIRSRTIEQQLLSIYDDRIQTEQQLAGVYQKWTAQVQVQHRIVLRLMLISLAWVLGILMCMVLGVALVQRLLDHPRLDVRQSHTLRGIVVLCIQIVGVVCILLVIFGVPQQTATMLGLGTAALTVALQDFILAFLGWFVLIGRKGMRVGDTVEIDGVAGEVVEIGLFSTTLLETGSLATRGLPTGRRISLLNSFAIKGKYFNFSTSGQWMWDQLEVAVPATAETHEVAEQIQAAVEAETAEDARLAEREWSRSRAAGLMTMQARPTVNLRPAGNEFSVEVRYVTRAAQRFESRNRLYRRVGEVLQKAAARTQS